MFVNNLKKHQRGLSVIELMVGLTVGLLALSGILGLFTSYLGSNSEALQNARLNQELRAVTDLIARDIRRAGYWQGALNGLYSGTAPIQSNGYTGITVAGTPSITYAYARDADNVVNANTEQFGFRLSNGAVQMLRSDAWVDLTDTSTVTITGFTINQTTRSVPLSEYCVNTCVGANCPTLSIRLVQISVQGYPTGKPSTAIREMREQVRLRNDLLSGACS